MGARGQRKSPWGPLTSGGSSQCGGRWGGPHQTGSRQPFGPWEEPGEVPGTGQATEAVHLQPLRTRQVHLI